MKTFKLNGEITWFDWSDPAFGTFIGPNSVQAWLKTLKEGETAEIEINSPGGDVVSGLAIANSIKNSKAHIRAHVIGVAASMASVIACACETLVMEEGSFLMVHNPWTETVGNADDLRKTADVLDTMRDALLSFYRSKFGGTEEELKAMLDDETWMNGREAQAAGFICEVIASDVKIAAAITQKMWDKAPEEARKFMKIQSLPQDVAKMLESPATDETTTEAKTETAAETADVVTETVESAESPAETSAESQSETQTIAETATETHETAESAESPANDSDAVNSELETLRKAAAEWEARYKGASKAINERDQLKAKLAKIEDELKTVKVEFEAAVNEKNNFKDQLDAARRDLESAKTDCSVATDRADNAERDLAQSREQLDRMEKAHRLLTGGVLSPESSLEGIQTKESELDKACSPKARESVRAKYSKAKHNK